ncbi:MAG: nitroreductase [Treponema sp.]|jgi:nitroreductase|nr:nitroreductase [Treponema sp.]
MTVREALFARHSFRAFLPRPIEQEKLRAILDMAQRAPSWANSQPWEVFVVSGPALDRIREGFAKKREEKAAPAPETEFPREWTEDAKRRQRQLGPDMERDCGEAVRDFGKQNQNFFDAPTVIYLCVDRTLSHWSLYDTGAWSQSFLLAAIEEGIGGIQAAQTALYPDVIRSAANIPDNLRIVIGIAIGYVDGDNRINNFTSARDPLETVVRWVE